MSLRSTGGPFGPSITLVASAAAGPMKPGGALGTARSRCQSVATRPEPAAAISSRKPHTTSSEIMPTRSLRKRLHAMRQTPSERCVAAALFIATVFT